MATAIQDLVEEFAKTHTITQLPDGDPYAGDGDTAYTSEVRSRDNKFSTPAPELIPPTPQPAPRPVEAVARDLDADAIDAEIKAFFADPFRKQEQAKFHAAVSAGPVITKETAEVPFPSLLNRDSMNARALAERERHAPKIAEIAKTLGTAAIENAETRKIDKEIAAHFERKQRQSQGLGR